MCKGEREEWEIDFFSKKRVRDEEGREREMERVVPVTPPPPPPSTGSDRPPPDSHRIEPTGCRTSAVGKASPQDV
jgi:hypothetical protein